MAKWAAQPHRTSVMRREVQRILMELLNQMDGFDQNVNVKVTLCHVPST